MTKYKIEKGVEFTKYRGKWDWVAEMQVNDSVFVETQKEADGIRYALRWRYRKAKMRKIDGGYRVWRVT